MFGVFVQCGSTLPCLRRFHLYGDIYSSPGLSLLQKQLLMVAFLGEADMHEQLFGHLIAVSASTERRNVNSSFLQSCVLQQQFQNLNALSERVCHCLLHAEGRC